jgi:glyceraldehyde 3-phosphate dehydrogenase
MDAPHTSELKHWVAEKKLAIQAIALIYDLYVDRSVELLLFRRRLVSQGPVAILKFHKYARQISKTEFGLKDSLPIIRELSKMDLCPSRIDVGRLTLEWIEANRPSNQLRPFLEEKLKDHLNPTAVKFEPRDVVLYGFGRIGRILARILIDQEGGGDALRLKAVVCRGKLALAKRANLLLRDSVHGSFGGNIEVLEEQNALLANGTFIQFISAEAPDQIDYTRYGIHNALIIDNTGVWRDRAGLELHLKAKGAERVLLTAPGKGDIPNIVYGVNSKNWKKGEKIFSAASCTTNAIVPPLKVLNDAFGIEYVHVETVHAYTNDQNLLDNFHPKERRGRSAPLNMVITETGAASAIAKALPELTGRVTGSAVRVPTPDVSLVMLNLHLNKAISREEINECLRLASLKGPLVAQIDYTRDEEVVSTDMVGNDHPAIVDSLATQVHGNHATVYVWYDNEFGYSMQVARMARIVSGVERLRYY